MAPNLLPRIASLASGYLTVSASVIEDSMMAKSFMTMENTGCSAEGRAYTYKMKWGAGALLPLSSDSLNLSASSYYGDSTQAVPSDAEGMEDPFSYDNGVFNF